MKRKMLFQIDLFVVRAILSLSIQLFGGISAMYVATRLLKRRKNKMTLPISMFYILLGSGYLLLAAFIFVLIDPISFVVYIVSYNLMLFSYVLNIVFSTNLLRPKEESFSKWQILYMASYAIGNNLLLLVPNSIRLDVSTNWLPILGVEFSTVLMIYYSIVVFIPGVYLILKILAKIREELLKNRLKMFLTGNLWFLITVYGLIFYLAMPENLIYRNIYSVFSFFNIVPIALIYFGTKEI